MRAPASPRAGALSRSVEPSRRITSTATAGAVLDGTDKRLLAVRFRLVTDRLRCEHDLQRLCLRCIAERLVCAHHLIEREPMRCERQRIQLPLPDELEEARRAVRVDEPHRDRQVADPERLEMQGRRVPVDADVCNATAWADELGAELERLRDADRF